VSSHLSLLAVCDPTCKCCNIASCHWH
jgi:hypothetical protein